jgi:hypothetical protein
MKNSTIIKKRTGFAGLLAAFVFFMACTENFDKHYQSDSELVSSGNLMELIEQQPELSVFASLLRKTSYDKILSGNQSYTVWAPVNEALAGIDLNNETEVLRTVKNHIARFVQGASGPVNKTIYMLDAKFIRFENAGNKYRIGDSELLKMNMVAKNGILHTIGNAVPFMENLWEYMEKPEYSHIMDYLYSFNEERFIPELSTPVDINTEGLIVYDSIFRLSNLMWETDYASVGLGYINDEDSVYTMILPTNKAWETAYEKIAPYFVSNDPVNADSIRDANTKYAIVQDLVFRGKQESFESMDSLISTREGIFYDPASLFEGGSKKELSNGWVYSTDQLNYNSWESWQRTIRVEAEETLGRENDATSLTYVRSAMDRAEISGYRYLDVYATTTASRPWVQFEIPNTLSAAYNIYCVFVPGNIANPSNIAEKTRVRFTVYQLRDGAWNPIASGGSPGSAITPNPNTTHSTELTKMLVFKNFVFPYSNYRGERNTIRIRVACAITAAEFSSGYSNNMRIDCLLLEPVH